MLKEDFGEQALSQARTFEWLKRFKDSWESVEDRKHSGRPSTCTTLEMIAKVHDVILEDRCWEVLLRGFEMTEGKCEVQTAWDVEEETGCCTMTMRLHTPNSL